MRIVDLHTPLRLFQRRAELFEQIFADHLVLHLMHFLRRSERGNRGIRDGGLLYAQHSRRDVRTLHG